MQVVSSELVSHMISTHFERQRLTEIRMFTVEIDINLKINLFAIFRVLLHTESTANFLALCGGKIVAEIEHSLFPVRVIALRPCRETRSFVTFGELHVKERHQRVNVVISLHHHVERYDEI